MKKYRFIVEAKNCRIDQTWEIEANSEEEAIKLYKDGGGEVIETEHEVLESYDPSQVWEV